MFSIALGLILVASPVEARWQAMVKDGFRGAAIAVSPNRPDFVAASGPRRAEGADSLTVDTPLPICSVTKLMTASVVMDLIAEGKLKLETPLGERLLWVPEHAKKVTIQQLLTHASGLRNMDDALGKDPDGTANIYFVRDRNLRATRPRLNFLLGSTPKAEPGAGFNYNNVDFLALQAVVEAVDRRSLEASMRERVWKPAGMRATRFAPYGDWPAEAAESYAPQERFRQAEIRFNFGLYGGSGGVLSTASDMAKWLRWMLARKTDEMKGPHAFGFQGYGSFASKSDLFGREELLIERPGAIAFFQWQVLLMPERGTAVALFSNQAGVDLGGAYAKKGLVVELAQVALIKD